MSAAAHLRAMTRLALRALRSRDPAHPPPLSPRRKPAVERRGVVPDPARVAAYLRATDGGRIPAYQGAEAVVPPTYCATWEAAAVLELLAELDAPLPLGGVVHLESELIPLRLLRPGDRVRSRVELERSESTPRGVRLTVSTRAWNGADHLCAQGSSLFLVRSREPTPPKPAAEVREEDGGGWEELAHWRLRSGAGRRYARASGDYNPIHLWGWTARPFGYRRPILHGFCTQGMVAHALVEHLLGGDPAALRRLRVAFRAPLLLPARVRLLVRAREGAAGELRVAAEEGEKVYAEGSFVGG